MAMLAVRSFMRTHVLRSGRLCSRCFSSSHVVRQSLIEELSARGLIKSVTSPRLDTITSSQKIKLYCGVDPTAPSLHLGNLLTLMVLLHFHIRGHGAVALVGGATGQIGDPAGKSAQRDALAQTTLSNNVSKLQSQLHLFLQRGTAYARMHQTDLAASSESEVVDNAEWYNGLTFMSFMQVVGRNVRVQHMLNRDSVKNRMTSAEGMSYGEFTYQLLQAYDFWRLHKDRGVRLQVGGSDQFGNITAGIDLVGRMQQQEPIASQEVFGLTVPLLTTPSGEKFGKSAGNAIWLDPSMTSPFELYQYFVKTPDALVPVLLKLFSLLPLQEIDRLSELHAKAPAQRIVHHILAREMLLLVHGKEEADRVTLATRLLFPNDFPALESATIDANQIIRAFEGDTRLVKLSKDQVVGCQIGAVLRAAKTAASGKEVQRLVAGGGVTRGLEAAKVLSHQDVITHDWLMDGQLLLLRVGKNRFVLVQPQ